MYDYDLADYILYHMDKEAQFIRRLDIELSQAKPKSKRALGLIDSISYHEGALAALEKIYNKVRYNEDE